MSSTVRTERRGPLLVVTIDRPEARNAINRAVAEGLAAAVDLLDGDEDLRVGVLTGAGGYFSAGMDLKAFAAGERPFIAGRGFGGIVQKPPTKPAIAAVEGFALAGGLEVALCCDLVVAARDARLGIPEVRRGLVAAGGALLRLPRRVPYQVAAELALTGEPMLAERAAEVGLVNSLTDSGQALEVALELAARVSANAPLAVDASKRILRMAVDTPEHDAWLRQRAIADPVLASEDAREGAIAFAERRSPVWRGR